MNRNELLIEAKELLTKIGDPTIRIYDATIVFFREEADLTAFAQYRQGHIPGAAFFDHQAFSDATNKYMYMALPKVRLARHIGDIGIDKDSDVIFYANGLLSCATRAWWLLRYAGHENVRVLNGGLTAWKEAGGGLELGTFTYPATHFTCQLRPSMFANKEEVAAAMKDNKVCTVNTLNQASYDDAHITGSSLLPCSELMHDMAAFLPSDTLASRLKHEARHERIITYCGGGIAATVNAMAHLMVGNKNVSVYDGSMSEWVGEGMPTTRRGNA